MYIMSINNFCQELSPFLQLIGQALTVFKIALPIILIILCIVDIAKAVISSKSDEIKKYMKSFSKKVIACIAVFFIPTIIMVCFGFVGGFSDIKENSGIKYDACYDCMFKPYSSSCEDSVKLAEK